MLGSRSSTATRRPSWRSASSRAVASPTIPPPTTATSHSAGGGADRLGPVVHSQLGVCQWRRDQYDRPMALPLEPPLKPQLALSRKSLPEDAGWAYEPKYDGFRALVFVDGDELLRPVARRQAARPLLPRARLPAGRYVVDGELVILDDDGAEVFDALQNRIHPAESRINRLAEETPARFRAFDLLAVDDARAARRGRSRSAGPRSSSSLGSTAVPAARRGLDRADAADARPRRGRALARVGRGRDRQAARRALPARQAHRDGQDQAAADDRRRRRRLAAGQGARAPSAR